jgi:hypothetical protein
MNRNALIRAIFRVLKAPSTASDPDWQPLANLDAILLLSGETPVEDEAVKKSTAFQVPYLARFYLQ